jgi:hypothetical protein
MSLFEGTGTSNVVSLSKVLATLKGGPSARATKLPRSRRRKSRRGDAETIMPEKRNTLFVLGVGAGFFLAMYEWVTMIAETMP